MGFDMERAVLTGLVLLELAEEIPICDWTETIDADVADGAGYIRFITGVGL
jgi:hypothetical protein